MSGSSNHEPPLLAKELRELRLPSVLEQWRAVADEAAKRGTSYGEFLAELIHREVVDRHDRRVHRRIQDARFPTLKTLDTFDFDRQPSVSREKVLELGRGDFVARRENVVIRGEIGTGE